MCQQIFLCVLFRKQHVVLDIITYNSEGKDL